MFADSKIDFGFTDYIRDAAESAEGYVGSLYTDAELDELLFGDDDVNDDFVVRLAEETVKRTTGVSIDLSSQGPASYALVNTTGVEMKEQAHNVYLVHDSKAKLKTYSAEHRRTVPKITAHDANQGIRNLDIRRQRPVGTQFDVASIEKNENPVERCMLNQLGVIQAIDHYGGDVTGLCSAVDQIYGINFAHALIKRVTLARAADLEAYIASGGRPAPNLYVSANITSRYVIDSRPMLTTEELDLTSLFWTRYANISKFTLTMTNCIRGNGSIPLIKMSMSKAVFPRFRESEFSKFHTEEKIDAPYSLAAETIVSKANLDEFMKTRNSLQSIERYSKMTLYKEAKMIYTPIDRTHQASRGIMAPIFDDIKDDSFGLRSKWTMFTPEEKAAPSKVSSILLGYFHKEFDENMYFSLEEFCNAVSILAVVPDLRGALPRLFPAVDSSRRIHKVLRSINIERANQAIKDLETMTSRSADPRRFVAMFLLTRHVQHVRLNIEMGIMTAIHCINTKKMTTKLREKRVKITRYAGIIRFHAILKQVLAVEIGIMPNKKYPTSEAIMHSKVRNKGLFGVEMHRFLKAWSDFEFKEQNRSTLKVFDLSIRDIRHTWTDFYVEKSRSVFVFPKVVKELIGRGKLIMSVKKILGRKTINAEEVDLLYVSAFVESAVMLGRALAFQFYQIKLKNLNKAELKDIGAFLPTYRKYLATRDTAEPFVTINSHIYKFEREESALAKAANAYAGVLNDRYYLITDRDKHGRAIMKEAYKRASSLVKFAIKEMIDYDTAIYDQFTKGESTQVDNFDYAVEEKEDIPEIKFTWVSPYNLKNAGLTPEELEVVRNFTYTLDCLIDVVENSRPVLFEHMVMVYDEITAEKTKAIPYIEEMDFLNKTFTHPDGMLSNHVVTLLNGIAGEKFNVILEGITGLTEVSGIFS